MPKNISFFDPDYRKKFSSSDNTNNVPIFPSSRPQHKDRFIHTYPKKASDVELQKMKIEGCFDATERTPYQQELCYSFYGTSYNSIRRAPILSFSLPKELRPLELKMDYELYQQSELDAPNLHANYYYNLVSWNRLAFIGLRSSTWACNPKSREVYNLTEGSLDDAEVTLVSSNNNLVLQGASDNTLKTIDIESGKLVSNFNLTCAYNTATSVDEAVFYIGNLNDGLALFDTRCREIHYPSSDFTRSLLGLAYHARDNTLAMSTDASVKLFDIRRLDNPRLEFKGHGNSNSKAIAFSPGEECKIATGGGAGDQTIRIWSTITGTLFAQTKSVAQICGLHYLGDKDTIFAAEGYSTNRVSCWAVNNTSSLSLVANSKSVNDRILYSAQNPFNPKEIVTAHGEEEGTLTFWALKKSKANPSKKEAVNLENMFQIR